MFAHMLLQPLQQLLFHQFQHHKGLNRISRQGMVFLRFLMLVVDLLLLMMSGPL